MLIEGKTAPFLLHFKSIKYTKFSTRFREGKLPSINNSNSDKFSTIIPNVGPIITNFTSCNLPDTAEKQVLF